jgi:hypothetical protein
MGICPTVYVNTNDGSFPELQYWESEPCVLVSAVYVWVCVGLSCIYRWKDSDDGVCCTELFGSFWTLSIVWYVKVLQKTTTFRRLDLSPSSGGWGRVDLLSWARQKELVQWLRLAEDLGTETDPVSETLWSFVKLPHTRRCVQSKRRKIVLYSLYVYICANALCAYNYC